MTIISLEHAEPKIEGYLCRHMYKVRPGVFVGRLSSSRRTLLWNHILEEQPSIDAVMCFNAAHKQIDFKTNGAPSRKVLTIDGIPLLTFEKYQGLWRKFLAKPAYTDSKGEYHGEKLLWEHMIETGIFANILLTKSTIQSITDILMECVDKIQKKDLIETISFLIAMHDIGKVSPYFQFKMEASEDVLCEADIELGQEGFRHERYSGKIVSSYLRDHGFDRKTASCLGNVIRDHHQCKVQKTLTDIPENINKGKLEGVITDFILYMQHIFRCNAFVLKKEKENTFCQLFSGILRCSDWIASACTDDNKARNFSSEEDYLQMISVTYLNNLIKNGMMPSEPNERYRYDELFPIPEQMLRPLQKEIRSVVKEHNMPDCIIIEGEPGSGKTEAGIFAAMNIMKACNKQGLYFALPTGATAEAMLSRLQSVKEKVKIWDDTNLKLFTGTAWMRDESDSNIEEKISWTRSGPRKLFSKIACGTVDQLMAIGESLKAGDMRLVGISNKVVIIDEFHAYDSFMMEIIKIVLAWLKELHVPVIILSATLQKSTIQKICNIYSPDTIHEESYPLITVAEKEHIRQYPCEATFHKKYEVATLGQDALMEKIIMSIDKGGNTLYVANTVAHAYQLYRLLQKEKSTDTELHIYTARMSPGPKERMGSSIIYRYGRNGKMMGNRPRKSILITTQIAEMSMDVDFDTVFSELAPIDSLLQRIGRMQRHEDTGTIRESGFKSVFYLVLPNKEDRLWELPYAKSIMEATQETIAKYNTIRIPEDVRALLEAAYKKAGEEWEREAVSNAAHASMLKASLPQDRYQICESLRSAAETRYNTYKTKKILVLPEKEITDLTEGRILKTNKDWSEKIVKECSVSVPENIYEKLDIFSVEQQKKPVWIEEFEVVKDHEEYHGPDEMFVGGMNYKMQC